ncbi:hypothetical protein B9Z55_029092 [Caenorhabditis nigoni]|uniref:Uncharacterized protein n=1 Tax=Caenorhabditis nigoni TaxID=1611254 RepID=A0A2G5S938_9PELO|nr:hypothetical protein B9Z55_029092 [Caenorhabditis nigoni]
MSIKGKEIERKISLLLFEAQRLYQNPNPFFPVQMADLPKVGKKGQVPTTGSSGKSTTRPVMMVQGTMMAPPKDSNANGQLTHFMFGNKRLLVDSLYLHFLHWVHHP